MPRSKMPSRRVPQGEAWLTHENPLIEDAFQIEVEASLSSIRSLLSDLRECLGAMGLNDDDCGTIEIALAEILNNIVEHAYAPVCEGPIRLSGSRSGQILRIELCDRGRAMPSLALPDQGFPDASVAREALPEGGFGWALIRALSHSLDYQRDGYRNRLRVEFLTNA